MAARVTRTEKDFTDSVIDLAKTAGWLVHHDRGDMEQRIQGHAGFLDLVMVRQLRVVFVELKIGANAPTAPQTRWIRGLVAAGQECYLWYPSDWDTRIVPCLTKR